MAEKQKDSSKIRVKMSKILFPDVCPVCLREPEDLVFVTILEKFDDYSSSSWVKQDDKTSVALDAAKGAVTFSIPTCMLHGSKSVRTLKTKLIAIIGFFVMFYPMLFYLLEINLALTYSRSVLRPVLSLIGTILIFLILLTYGLFPRALERAVRFHYVSRVKDAVLLSIKNDGYRERFLDLNGVSAVTVSDEHDDNLTTEGQLGGV
jgi:hypothetical protein